MKRILLFVHYNKTNALDERVLYTLKSVRNLFDTVVVISNSKLGSKDARALSDLSDTLIQRRNIGYDFSAWKEGLNKIGWDKLSSYDSLTLMNDTCHFPVYPIGPYFKKFEASKKIDFWGASVHKTSQHGMPKTNGPVPEHIQSYFTTFKKRVVISKTFRDFWSNLRDHDDVAMVIRDYETKLTGLLNSAGFQYDAIINVTNAVFNDAAIVNPAYQCPERLLEQKFPFIKLKAVSKYNFINIRNWIKKNSKYPSSINPYDTNTFVRLTAILINWSLTQTHLTFLAISIPAIIAFVFITPLGFGGDEAAHAYKSYSISQGDLFSVKSEVPKNLSDTVEYGWVVASQSPWGSQVYKRHDVSDSASEQIHALGNKKLNSNEMKLVTYYNGASYPATVYAGSAIGMRIGSALNLSVYSTLIIARLLNAIPFLLFGAAALYILRTNMAKWLIFTVLLTPTVISYASTINGDPYNISVVAMFFALFLHSINNRPKIAGKYLWFLVTTSALLALAKIPSALLVGLLFFIPSNRFSNSKDKWLKTGAIVVATLLLAAIITKIGYGQLPYQAGSASKIAWVLSNPLDTVSLVARTIYLDFPDYINRSVGVIGRNGVYVHQSIILLLFIWLTVLALFVDKVGKKRGVALLAYTSLLCLAIIGLLFTGDPENTINKETVWGVHGKYFTPFIPIIVYGLGILAPFRVVQNKNYIGIFTILLMATVSIASILTYQIALY